MRTALRLLAVVVVALGRVGRREDVATGGDRSGELLALAPESNGGFYLVPRVIE